MEHNVFEMLEALIYDEIAGYNALNEKLTMMHFTEVEIRSAFAHLNARGLIEQKPGEPVKGLGFIYGITDGGKKAYRDEKKIRDDAKKKEEMERAFFINQDKLQRLNIENAQLQISLMKSQLQLNPLVKEANESSISTNAYVQKTNAVMKNVLYLTAFISGISAVTTILNYTSTTARTASVRSIKPSDEAMQSLLVQSRGAKDTVYINRKDTLSNMTN